MGQQVAIGTYQMACETSPNKTQIDLWLNEGKSNLWISRELQARFNEKISDKAVGKYRKYREQMIQEQLSEDPDFKKKMEYADKQLSNSIGKMQTVNIIDHLADTINRCAEMLRQAEIDDIKIKNVQDMRFVSMTMLDAIKQYGDVMLKMQRFNAVNEDPTLLKPQTINVNIRGALTDILRSAMSDGSNGYALIDKLRAGIAGKSVQVIDIPTDKEESDTIICTDTPNDVIEYNSDGGDN